MRKVHRRLAAVSALVVAATGLVIAGLTTGAQAGCEDSREVDITDVVAYEGSSSDNRPETRFVFTVTSAGCAQPGAVEFAVSPETTDEKDLRYIDGRLTFTEGDLKEQQIIVAVSPDDTYEPWETFRVALQSPSGRLTFCNDFAIGTIVNDDDRKDPIVIPSMLQRCELHKSR